jgi:hypothetical protein
VISPAGYPAPLAIGCWPVGDLLAAGRISSTTALVTLHAPGVSLATRFS